MIIEPIGIIHSPYKEKFAVPRQPSLVEGIISEIELLPPYNTIDAFRGIQQYSHLWMIFGFNLVEDHSFRPLVRPPRLGGNSKMGIFACRSPFRPNNLGLSAVTFKEIIKRNNTLILKIGGGDLVEGTPIYDIKPYIGFSDAKLEAKSGFATEKPSIIEVRYDNSASDFLNSLDSNKYPLIKELISDILAYDPRPAYRKKEQEDLHNYAVKLYDFDVKFKVLKDHILVTTIENIV